VLPILHLNGYKIANPCFLARIPQDELRKFFEGMGYTPYFVEGRDPQEVHQQLAGVLDTAVKEIRHIWDDARNNGMVRRPAWPMIVFRTPKGWTCPPEIDGKKCEDYWRSHQVPMGEMHKEEHVRILEQWMKSYRPDELFDADGRLLPELAALAPTGHRRMSDNPHANGGLLLRDLKLPDFRDYAVKVPRPGATTAESARVMGKYLRDVMQRNLPAKNFRLFSPDDTWRTSIRRTIDSLRTAA
jgi:xylulose-5-phosphate/fructose-6-phosphate phosphoketolase